MSTMGLEIEQGFATLTMREEGRFNLQSLEEMNVLLDQLEADEDAKALLLTGEGKFFAQGLDLDVLLKMPTEDFYQYVENTMVMVSRILSFPIPVVTVVNGHAFGLGAMIAIAGDYSVMRADRGYICLPEIDLGMAFIPTMAALVTNKLSGKIRRDMMLTGRRVGGEDAVAHGVVDATCSEDELIAKAKELVQPALDKRRDILSAIKRDLNLPIIEVIEAGVGVRGSASSVR